MQWYYSNLGQRQGPVAEEEFNRLVREGTIRGDTLVWREGMANWQAYSEIAKGGGAAQTALPGQAIDDGTALCAVSGKPYPKREMIQVDGKWISAEFRDEYFQRLREGVVPSGEIGAHGYGGFWIRFAARLIDNLILAAAVVLVGLVFSLVLPLIVGRGGNPEEHAAVIGVVFLVVLLLFFAGTIFYDVYFYRKYDATPGKMALGLRTVTADGSKMGAGRIIGRYFAHILSGFFFNIGYIIAAFDDEKRALHDRICDTRVVKTR